MLNEQKMNLFWIRIAYWLGIAADALWAVREPIERRAVILLTAFPVVFGLSIVALVAVLAGNTFEIWILIKNAILFISMISSYVMASKMARESRHAL